MHLKFWRASTPKDIRLEDCSVCGRQFQTSSVTAMVMDRPRGLLLGLACPPCIEVLGQHAPERFPSIEEYEAALQRYPEPVWASDEEADHALDNLRNEVPDLWILERS